MDTIENIRHKVSCSLTDKLKFLHENISIVDKLVLENKIFGIDTIIDETYLQKYAIRIHEIKDLKDLDNINAMLLVHQHDLYTKRNADKYQDVVKIQELTITYF